MALNVQVKGLQHRKIVLLDTIVKMEPGQSAQLVPIQIRLIWFTNLIARAVREANSVSKGPASLVEIAIQVISVLEDQTQKIISHQSPL
jgi:hypothetical protein